MSKTSDSSCYDLADSWLSNHDIAAQIDDDKKKEVLTNELALRIQETIEDFLDEKNLEV